MSQFSIEIVTPERKFYSGEIDAISLTTLSGRIQILAHHMNYATGILPSVLKIKAKDDVKVAAISGGFIEFTNNKATIMADSVEWPEDIDKKRAESSEQRAKERLEKKESVLDKNRAQISLMRAMARIKATEYHIGK